MAEQGRRIPGDVSLVGFDDVPEAAYLHPALTTIRQDFDEMGTRGVRLLLRTMAAGRPLQPGPDSRPELVVRSSTSAVRSG